ncbi:hypothetical protein CR513_60891, partial [Mucuna pruriens]
MADPEQEKLLFSHASIDPSCAERKSNERFACGRDRVPHSRQQKPATAHTHCVVASPRRFIHQNVTRVTRICPFSEYSGARRHRLQRRHRRPLVVPIPERVRHRSGQHRRQSDYHSVHPDVAVRRNQRRSLRAVHRLVEWPRALPGTLRDRVTHPRERNPITLDPTRPMGSTSAHAEILHCHVSRSEHHVDVVSAGCCWYSFGSEGVELRCFE